MKLGSAIILFVLLVTSSTACFAAKSQSLHSDNTRESLNQQDEDTGKFSAKALEYYNEAVKQQKVGDNEKAIANYKKALSLDKRMTEGWTNLGSIYATDGATTEAIECFQHALTLCSGSKQSRSQDRHTQTALVTRFICLYNLGSLYSAITKYQKAESYYEQAASINVPEFEVPTEKFMSDYAILLRKNKHETEAKELEAKAALIRDKNKTPSSESATRFLK